MRAEALPDGMGALTVQTGREAITAVVADLDALRRHREERRRPAQPRADPRRRTHPSPHPRRVRRPRPPRLQPRHPHPHPRQRRPRRPRQRLAGLAERDRGAGDAGQPDDAAATWLHLADHPGELDGYGPTPAALARQIAADAARDHPTTTTWRCVPIDDIHRSVLGVGDTIPTPFTTPPPTHWPPPPTHLRLARPPHLLHRTLASTSTTGSPTTRADPPAPATSKRCADPTTG